MSKPELKPCPFCGGEAVFITESNGSSHHGISFSFTIKCGGCGCRLPKVYSLNLILGKNGNIEPQVDMRKEAVETWNRRAGNE